MMSPRLSPQAITRDYTLDIHDDENGNAAAFRVWRYHDLP